MVKRLPTTWETRVQSLGREDLLEKAMAPHSSTLAWKIPWLEEPVRLQFMGLQRIGHDCATSLHFLLLLCGKTAWNVVIEDTGRLVSGNWKRGGKKETWRATKAFGLSIWNDKVAINEMASFSEDTIWVVVMWRDGWWLKGSAWGILSLKCL